MKNFVLYSSREKPIPVNENAFEDATRNEEPFKQLTSEGYRYYATCPECENPVQLIGLYTSGKKYAAHAGKTIPGLNPYNQLEYEYCPRSVKGKRVPKDSRKPFETQKDINVYNALRENFDLAISFAKKHLGFYIGENLAKKALEAYCLSKGWLYPHSTVNNVPFMLFYLYEAVNPYKMWVKKNSKLHEALQKSKYFEFEPIDNPPGANYYDCLIPRTGHHYFSMMFWNHCFKEDTMGNLQESICIQLSKDMGKNPSHRTWESVIDIKVDIPEHGFVRYINSPKTQIYRDDKLINFAKEIMPEVKTE